jgi:hypothetical protein
MVILTVVGEGQATAGHTFVYLGPLGDCKECRVRNVCFGLARGKRYRVVGPRKVKHACKAHEGGGQVVEVEEVPFDICIPEKGIVEGSAMTASGNECRHVGCSHFRLCVSVGVDRGMRLHVIELGERVECARGEPRRKARVR